MKKICASLLLLGMCQLSHAGGPVATPDVASGSVVARFVSPETAQLARVEALLVEILNTNKQIAATLAKMSAQSGPRAAK